LEVIKPFVAVSDYRGSIDEVVKGRLWKQLNYVRTNQGAIRGNHFHKILSELHYVVSGEIRVHIRDLRTNEEATYHLGEGSCFIVEPHEYHTLEHLTDTEYVVLFSEEFNPEQPDIHKNED